MFNGSVGAHNNNNYRANSADTQTSVLEEGEIGYEPLTNTDHIDCNDQNDDDDNDDKVSRGRHRNTDQTGEATTGAEENAIQLKPREMPAMFRNDIVIVDNAPGDWKETHIRAMFESKYQNTRWKGPNFPVIQKVSHIANSNTWMVSFVTVDGLMQMISDLDGKSAAVNGSLLRVYFDQVRSIKDTESFLLKHDVQQEQQKQKPAQQQQSQQPRQQHQQHQQARGRSVTYEHPQRSTSSDRPSNFGQQVRHNYSKTQERYIHRQPEAVEHDVRHRVQPAPRPSHQQQQQQQTVQPYFASSANNHRNNNNNSRSTQRYPYEYAPVSTSQQQRQQYSSRNNALTYDDDDQHVHDDDRRQLKRRRDHNWST